MLRKKIYIASGHAGFMLKEKTCTFLKGKQIPFDDLGTNDPTSCDYPDYAHLLASKIGEQSFGILICGSGTRVSIAANRHKNIRCALCNESLSAKLTRKHNNANVLAFGGRLIGINAIIDTVENFIQTPFDQGRHVKRIRKIEVDR